MWRDSAYLLDMVLAGRRVRNHIADVTWEQFQSSELLQDAVLHAIQEIGEAANQVSSDVQAGLPALPWAAIIGMRHRIVHGYRTIQLARVWSVATTDVPMLLATLEPLIPQDDENA